jgi:hypothetical protein
MAAKTEVTFTPSQSDSKKAQTVKKIVAAYKKAKTPLVFSQVCAQRSARSTARTSKRPFRA